MEANSDNGNWKPLESNPTVINEYITSLGFDATNFVFQDIFSVEEWAQQMIAQPCLGLMLIFPITENSEKHRAEEKAKIEADGQTVDDSLFYMHQYARNACGTVGVFHILGNLPEAQQGLLVQDGKLANFFKECEGKNWVERGKLFKGSKAVKESHTKAVVQGDTDVTEHEDNVNHHFISFIQHNGSLYELDGRKSFPVNHGATTQDTFLADACRVAQGFMQRDPDESGFGLICLAPPPQ
jgi:ubiquitin carboxyl-terminal hydrolase L3